MSDSPSLYETAIAELDSDVTPAGYIEALGPDWIRDTAAERLKADGVEVVGAPSLVKWAIDRKSEEIVSDLYLWLEQLPMRTKGGRTPNGFVHNLILTAAYYAFTQAGSRKTEARRAAAKRLGSPITKDKVEKAERIFRRDLSRLMRSFERERMLRLTASLVLQAQDELQSIEAHRRDEEAARHKRRFYRPDGDCFRAASNSSVVDPQR